MAGKKKEEVEVVVNTPEAEAFMAIVEEYKKRNPKKAEAKKAEFAAKLEALNK